MYKRIITFYDKVFYNLECVYYKEKIDIVAIVVGKELQVIVVGPIY